MKIFEFDAPILKHDSIDAAYIEFPYDVKQEFGTDRQVKVKATFEAYEYRGSLAKMGHHCHCLGLTQKVRKDIGKQPGDIVHVVIVQDDEPRKVDIPHELQNILDLNPKAKEVFNKLSYTNQKEFVNWITTAKKIETKETRLKKTIILLLDGKKHP